MTLHWDFEIVLEPRGDSFIRYFEWQVQLAVWEAREALRT